MGRRQGSRRWRHLLLVVGLTMVGGAVTIAVVNRPAVANAGLPVNLGAIPRQQPARDEAASSTPTTTAVQPIRPGRVRIPALGVDAAVVPVDMNAARVLAIPADPLVVGWWEAGAPPGAPKGTAVLAGHVNSARRGPGALVRLHELRPGDQIFVGNGDVDLEYQVEAVRQYEKKQLPADELFRQDVAGRLAIVSCGGPFNSRTGTYRDNVIVYALLV